MPLATHERRIALRRARVLSVSLETLMTKSYPLTRAQAEAHVRAWIDRARDACERGLADTGFFHFDAAEIDAVRQYVPPTLSANPSFPPSIKPGSRKRGRSTKAEC